MTMSECNSGDTQASPAGAAAPLPEPVVRGRGRTRVEVRLLAQGEDLVVLVGGGLVHVGAVSVCTPPQPPADVEAAVQAHDAGRRRGLPPQAATFQATNIVPGHKEGPLADEAARVLAAASGRTCVAVVGIHQDDASGEEITAIVKNTRTALRTLADRLSRSTKA